MVNALWTALVVACVKLTPLLLFGVKLLFQSVIPLAGMAVFNNRKGLFANVDDDDPSHEIENDDEDRGEHHHSDKYN